MEPRAYRFPTVNRLGFMGGAYGNIPALRACVEHARRNGCERLVFLGDATGCCGHSDETVLILRQHFDVMIQGNHEEEAVAGSLHCGCGYDDPEDERIGCMAHEYATKQMSDNVRGWLSLWPKQALISMGAGKLLLCHGSPDHINEFLYESLLDDARLQHWLDQHDAAGFLCTHTGLPWLRDLPSRRFAANSGVVGKPDHDGDPAVHYVIVEANPNGRWSVWIQRVEYDHRAWADQLQREGVDAIFTEPLRTGWWTTGIKSLPPTERAARQSMATSEQHEFNLK